jgi:hypothetical protein
MKKLVLVLAAIAALATLAPAVAAGGGWATVGLSSLPPKDLAPGSVWTVDLTVLQHGRTPLEHVQPVVKLHGPDGVYKEVAATRTEKPGVYSAVVRFPSEGTWRYEIDDGFTQVHTYAPVTVRPVSSPGSFPTLPIAAAALALALTLGVALAFALRRRRAPVVRPAALGR